MVVENAVEGNGTIFGELTAFLVELTRVVRTLARSICPALYIGEPFFQSSPALSDLRILHGRFAIPKIDIQPNGNKKSRMMFSCADQRCV